MHTNNKLAKSIRLALMFGATATAMTGVAIAQDSDEGEKADKIERIQVTGSRLNRTDMEGALPITVIGREDLQASGEISVADYMRDTNFNSFGSYQSTSGSSGGGAAQVSLRGLGAGRTLVLIDGRRLPVSPILGGGQDLNSIPMAAVERIEVLTDGASAVYGSDAIAGVINVITRKDYEGVEMTVGAGRPTEKGGDTEEMSFVVGSYSDKGRILFGASMNKRDVVMTRDRDYWYSAPGASTYSNNFSRMLDVKDDDGNIIGQVHSSSLGSAGRLRHPDFGAAVPGLCTNEEELFWMSGSGPDDWTCQFNHSATSANLTSTKNLSMFGRSDYQINDDWSIYLNGGYNKVESFGRFAALPSSPWPGGAIAITPDSPNHPGNPNGYNPHNDDPYYRQLWEDGETLSLYHRFAALGPRDNSVENSTVDFSAGAEGMIGDVFVEFGARYVQSRALNLGVNYVVGGLAQTVITDGGYNIYDPFAGDPSSLGMTATINRDMHSVVKEVYANASFDLFELSNGNTVSASIGTEYRDEDFQDQYDLLSAAGQVSGSSGASSKGARDVKAFYGEILFPILDSLEVEFAGRYDSYSDYGSDFSPKVAMRWRPTEEILVRASYGEGFRAPTLRELSLEPAFSAAYTNDPATCIALKGEECVGGSDVQVTTYSMGNVNLDSENSKQYGLGVVWAAADWINASLDYYNIEITNSISSIGLSTAVNCLRGLSNVCPDGISQFQNGISSPDPSLGVGVAFEGNDVNNAITYAQLGGVNLGKVETNGYDFSVNTNFDVFGGRLLNNFTVSYVNKYTVNNGRDATGDYGQPALKAALTNTYAINDFTFNWNVSVTDSQKYRYNDSAGNPAVYHVPTWIIHNVQANYNTPWNATISLGVTNLTNKAPADAELAGTSYDYYQYDPWGRVPYVRYTQRF